MFVCVCVCVCVLFHSHCPKMEALVSHFVLKKERKSSEELRHIGFRSTSLAPKLMLIITIHVPLLPTIHQSREAVSFLSSTLQMQEINYYL